MPWAGCFQIEPGASSCPRQRARQRPQNTLHHCRGLVLTPPVGPNKPALFHSDWEYCLKAEYIESRSYHLFSPPAKAIAEKCLDFSGDCGVEWFL